MLLDNHISKIFKIFGFMCFLFFLTACSDGSGGGASKSFDFLDPVDNGQGETACTITSSSPSASTTRIAITGTTATNFLVVSSGTNCQFKYKLNGIQKVTTANFSLLPSDPDLSAGANTLLVEVSNSKGTATKEWTVTRNVLPTCGTGSPVYPTPVAVSIGTPQTFQVIGANDPDLDPLTFSWKLDGSSVAALNMDVASATFSQATFTSTGAHIGTRTVSANISDGFDTQVCSWTANVAGSCAITSTTPSATSLKVAALGSTLTGLSLATATPGCLVNWTVNGVPIPGTTPGQSILSSSLVTGVNAITATTSSGATTTWFVQKNSAPLCAQVPSPSPTPITGVGNPIPLTVNITDSDDPAGSMTYVWKLNGSIASTLILNNLNGVYTSVGTFTPTVAEVGTSNVTSTVSDGFDSTTCTWPVRVVNACSIISYFPSASVQKIPFLAGSNQSYLVTPNDATVCSVTWTVNGTTVGSSSNIFSLLTSEPTLNAPGVANTLRATLTNGYGSTVFRDWIVTRNSAPSCNAASQLPATLPVEFFYTSPQNFSASIFNTDSDPIIYTWKLNGGNTGLFGSILGNSTSSSATLNATSGQIGDGQSVAMEFTDSYDSNQCLWTANIRDASTVAISSCSFGIVHDTVPPSTTRVDITATGLNSSRDFVVLATGVDLTYSWERDGSPIAGYTNSASPSFTADQSNWPSNTHTLKVKVKDRYLNERFCQWNVKKNDKPTMSSPTPTTTELTAATYKYNYKRRVSTPISEYGVALQISAQDLNTDDVSTLKFQWFRDGVRQYNAQDTEITSCSSGCPSVSAFLRGPVDLGATPDVNVAGTWTSSRVFNPYAFSDNTLLGESEITARVIDTTGDYRDISWKIQANQFSQACNDLYNGPVDSNKKICTLVGSPSIGQGSNWDTDPLLFRIYPRDVKRDVDGGIWITDNMSHTVIFFNDTVTPQSRVGFNSIPGKTMQVIVGNGADGRNQDNPVPKQEFKLNLPIATAYDRGSGPGTGTDALYISDFNNDRVVVVNSVGLTSSFLGSNPVSSPLNNLAGNTAGALSTSHHCSRPAGLKINVETGTKYLYVACNNSHAIKKVNIQTPGPIGVSSYGVTNIFVGRLNSSNQTVAGFFDGTPGPTGSAEVYAPWEINTDSAGNIYWTEDGSSGKVRYYNATGATKQFFPNITPQPYNTTIYASDMSNVLAQTTLASFNASDPNLLSAANRVTIKGPSRIIRNNINCYPIRIQLNDASARLARFGGGTTSFSMTFSNVSLFTESTCSVTAGVSPIAFSLLSTQFEKQYWIKSNIVAANFTVAVTETPSSYFAGGNKSASLTAIPMDAAATMTVATSMVISSNLNQFSYLDCHPVQLQFRNAGVISQFGRAGIELRWGTSGVGNFYSASNCAPASVINSIIPLSTDSEKTIYFQRTNYALAGRVQSLVGCCGANSISQATMYDVGGVLLNWPQGLAIKETAGVVDGFLISSYNNHSIVFVNARSTIQNFAGQVFLGTNHASALLTTTAAFWQNDSSAMFSNRLYTPRGIDFDNATQKLLIADLNNYRIRYVDLSVGTNPLTTYLGSGRSRNMFLTDSEASSEANLNFPTGIYIENSSKKMFISDSTNGRIREVSMLRGTLDLTVGRGQSALGQSFSPGSIGDPKTSVFMRVPEHVYAHNSGGRNFVMWMEQQNDSGGVGAINRTCALKVLNRSASPATLFGFNVDPDRVINILGNYALGCVGYSGDGPNAQLVGIQNATGFATDGSVIYVAATADHCILKVDNTGAVSRVIGTCGVAGAAANTTGALALVRYPTNILIDPLNPTNYFFLDQTDVASASQIRYVNNTNTAILFGDPGGTAVYAAANGGAGSTVTTIWTPNTAGGQAGRMFGIASFGNRICWSSGGVGFGVGINGNAAPHVVSCADRTDTNLSIERIVGPSDASVLTNTIRAGGPFGTEQEGVNGPTARLNGPWGITFDADGNLYIADRSNGIIRMVRRWF